MDGEYRLPARSRNWREWCKEVSLIRGCNTVGVNKACWDALEKEINSTKKEHVGYKGQKYTTSWAHENNQLDIVHYQFDGLTVYLLGEDNKPTLKPNPERPYSWDHIVYQDKEGEPSTKDILNEMANTPISKKWLTPLPKGRGFEAWDQEWKAACDKHRVCPNRNGQPHIPTKRKWYQFRKPEWACSKCLKPMKMIPTFEQL